MKLMGVIITLIGMFKLTMGILNAIQEVERLLIISKISAFQAM